MLVNVGSCKNTEELNKLVEQAREVNRIKLLKDIERQEKTEQIDKKQKNNKKEVK